mgnify:FL=1
MDILGFLIGIACAVYMAKKLFESAIEEYTYDDEKDDTAPEEW